MPSSARIPVSPIPPEGRSLSLRRVRGAAPYRVGGDVAKEDGLPRQRARWRAMTGWGGPPLFPHPPVPP